MQELQDNKHHYLKEPILNSELILVNNAKLLKKDPSIFNDEYLKEINDLRQEFIVLEERSDQGETGLQKEKRRVRDELREISVKTFVERDTQLFGQMITTMAKNIVTRPQFSGYTYREEMQSLAIQHILLYTWKFNPYQQSKITGQYISAFAYISTIIFNACIATINKFKLEQDKAKSDFLEQQKLIHRTPNASTIGPDFEDAEIKVNLPNLPIEENALLKEMKIRTIEEATEFYIPEHYKISKKELDFVMKYVHNISIRRIKDPDSWFPDPNDYKVSPKDIKD